MKQKLLPRIQPCWFSRCCWTETFVLLLQTNTATHENLHWFQCAIFASSHSSHFFSSEILLGILMGKTTRVGRAMWERKQLMGGLLET